MVRVVVGGAGSLVEAGVVVGIGAGVGVATAVVGTDVAGFVTGVGTAVTPGFIGLGASIVRSGIDVGAVGAPVALGTEEMVVGAVVASMRSGVSVVIWPEASVAVSSSVASEFAGEPRSHGFRGRCRSRAGQEANQHCNGRHHQCFPQSKLLLLFRQLLHRSADS